MKPTKDQKAGLITDAAIEAAARSYAYNTRYDTFSMESGDVDNDAFKAGALWMQAEMEKLIEQRERAAYSMGQVNQWNRTFEDWKKAK